MATRKEGGAEVYGDVRKSCADISLLLLLLINCPNSQTLENLFSVSLKRIGIFLFEKTSLEI